MQFARVVEVYDRIEATTKRLEMTNLLVGLLRATPPADLDEVVYLTQGRIHPDYMGIELGLAEKMVIRVLAYATGLEEERIETMWRDKGDLGLVAEEAIASRRQKPLESTPLTVAKVYDNLDAIARESGEGSQDRKIRLLSDLLSNATPREAKYIVRMVVGKMRLGVADMTIIDALATTFATKADRDRVERAYNVSSDLGEVARVIAAKGLKGLDEVRLKLFRPIRAMLAERLETLEEIVQRMGKAALEYKYDGLRVQAHISPSKIQLFSRHLEDITGQFPEIVEGLRKLSVDRETIVEGEAVPVDANTGEFLPFQEVSRRRGRKTDVERMAKEFPVTLFTFDCLLRGEEDLTPRPYSERRKALETVINVSEGIRHSTVRVTDDVREAERFFDEALQAGCEGLMAKALDSPYEAGARGYQWIKFKKEYSAALSDTIDLVIVGAFAGRGKRAGSYGALLMAAYDEASDVFRTTCKLGTGFDDETLRQFPEKLKAARRERRPARVDSKIEPDIWFNPEVVLEVRGAELTVSPVHTAAWDAIRSGAGLAVRFPRFTGRWREDKGPEDATTVKELLEMYRGQLKRTKGSH
ncbi:MAG: ATP-dependent DNA ligase [Methanobacteriota archaeon]|nr:MAG: ATP-dependent DNA ligase [Euryarchaeota archaeon]